MPQFAHLRTDLRCPFCDTIVTDLVWFQWGLCPGYHPRDEYLYHVGDPIRWKRCGNGSILTWVYFRDGEQLLGANIGDNAITNLIVKDSYQFYWDDPAKRRRCDACHSPLEGAVIEILEGAISRAWIYRPGEFDHETEDYIIQTDGTLKPMPEWNDHPMGSVRPEC